MSILVVGSVALDTVETPFGKVEDAMGGSAIYFSAAASYFAPVRIVAVVGDDFSFERLDFLRARQVDLAGLEARCGRTFRWGGRYGYDLNSRETLFTHLNVFQDFQPRIPDAYRHSEFVFLGNIAPELQLDVLEQIAAPRLVALDTMNYWIEGRPEALKRVLRRIGILIVNDSEVRELAGEPNLVRAARLVQEMGPEIVIIKKGEHGALMVLRDRYFWAPAYPLEDIHDPTGAGDTFAGGFMGYLARCRELSTDNFKRALIYGSAMASFCVERFSLERLENLSDSAIKTRFQEFWHMTHFDHAGSEF